MIIDAHIHPIGVGRSFADLGDKIKRVEDAISFNSRYPELYRKRFEEEPVDFCGALIGDMDRYNIDKGLIQLTTGAGTNDLVADAVSEHPGRLSGLIAGWATSYGRWDGLEVTSGAGGSAARARRSSWEMPSEKQHRWLGDHGPPFALLLAVDDATGIVVNALFCEQENTRDYFLLMKGLIQRYGIPIALYTDRHSVFKNVPGSGLAGAPTQFSRAMDELGMQMVLRLRQ